MACHTANGSQQRGVILLAMLVVLIIMSLSLTGAASIYAEQLRRDRELELLRVGEVYRNAIGRYYQNTPGVIKSYPPSLDALLLDVRQPVPQRYLRELYLDPLNPRGSWGVVEASSGGVMGIYSLAEGKPFKQSGFNDKNKHFENKKYYYDWLFIYSPR